MPHKLKIFLNIFISLLIISGIIYARLQISKGFDYQDSNFAFFWLAGKMTIDGENPYDETTYIANHEKYGIKWQPNRIFPYPLPLAILCIPLGFFSMGAAYTIWQIVSMLFIVISIYLLLNLTNNEAAKRLLIPIFLAMIFFGPGYLTLHTGAVGAFALLFLMLAVILLEKENFILAGILLSLTMLKPPQGLTILLLAGLWFLIKRNWKAIIGIGIGGILLFIIGLIQDPQWIQKFLGASDAVMDRTQGVHSNVWAFSYLICNGESPCFTFLGAALSLSLLGGAGYLLWKNQAWSSWEAMNLIIPIGFVSTIYLWAYDQITFVIPIVWIAGTLVQKSKSYLYSFLFLILLILVSFYALVQQAMTDKDLWSLGTTILVLLFLFIASKMKTKLAIDKLSPSA
ncbi:MAG: DUF2029 domain-containing protein [Anaerolineales bacterium]|nr:DUF2029 domain-containing protein [Anaerolineales bacterium]